MTGLCNTLRFFFNFSWHLWRDRKIKLETGDSSQWQYSVLNPHVAITDSLLMGAVPGKAVPASCYSQHWCVRNLVGKGGQRWDFGGNTTFTQLSSSSRATCPATAPASGNQSSPEMLSLLWFRMVPKSIWMHLPCPACECFPLLLAEAWEWAFGMSAKFPGLLKRSNCLWQLHKSRAALLQTAWDLPVLHL